MATAERSAEPGSASNPFPTSPAALALDRRTQEIGRELFERIGRGPWPWHRAWWDDRVMSWTLADPQVRVQLFRFIDALPALRSPSAVRRHLAEYLEEAGERVPWWLEPGGDSWRLRARIVRRLLAWSARSAAGVMARKFIAGATPDEAPGPCWTCVASRWPSRPTCWARP